MAEEIGGNTTPTETQDRVSLKAKKRGRKVISKKNKSLEHMEIEYVSTDEIIPNDYNPNRQSDHEFELLMKSMTEDGFTQPIVTVRREDGKLKIVDGEHRWRAAYTLGFEEIPVVVAPMTEEQAKISTLRHNRARGTENVDLTAELLRDLERLGALDWAQDSLMMDDAEVQKMLEDIPAPEALAAEDWSEAWEPGEMSEAQVESSVTNRDVTGSAGETVAAASIAAIERQRDREKKLAEAKTAEDRQALQKDHDIFRLYLTFTGDEAVLVKRVLGDEAAEKMIDLCRMADDGEKTEEEKE